MGEEGRSSSGGSKALRRLMKEVDIDPSRLRKEQKVGSRGGWSGRDGVLLRRSSKAMFRQSGVRQKMGYEVAKGDHAQFMTLLHVRSEASPCSVTCFSYQHGVLRCAISQSGRPSVASSSQLSLYFTRSSVAALYAARTT